MKSLRGQTIVFVTSGAGRKLGRVERRWLPVIEALVSQGVTVLVICALHAPFEDAARAAGATIAPYRLDKLNLVRTRSRLRKYLARYRPAIVHSTGHAADAVVLWAAEELPVKVVVSTSCTSLPAEKPRGIGSWARRRVGRASLSRLDALLVDCRDLVDAAVNAGVPRDIVALDPPSVRIRHVTEAARQVSVALPQGPPCFGYAGTLERTKGLHLLAAAAPLVREQHPEARAVIAGQGHAGVLVAAAARDGRIDLLGHVESVPAVLGALDVCVFPVTAPGTPTTLLEAAALGRPIVAAAVTGVAEMFADGREIVLVPPHDVRALADAVIGLLGDPDRARVLGEAARHTVIDRYSAAAAVERHLDLYRRLSAST
ncbi:MAG: glycosyltransferase family 4 protein [Coriobacteriales bacterium]|nr:glycosyltransferase family 4 protein [Actinomycetes bacterium]